VIERAEGWVVGAGDVELSWRGWLPATPTGVVLVCHGLAEHAGRYGNVVDATTPVGCQNAAHAADQR
jgi:alpha-beta hydrolase superfamily lysophospholipase